MTAPVAVARADPAGIKLKDGYRSLVTFTADPNMSVWERSITPPGYEGGEAVDTTTMHNDLWRSMAPRALITMSPFKMVVGYDPIIFTDLLALVNVETTITVAFPDGSTLVFYGFLQSFVPGDLAEGEFPMATITITPTNADPTTGAEEAPVLTNVPGT